LAKWYIAEPGSEQFGLFMATADDPFVARPAVVEFRCLLARHRRAGRLGPDDESAAYELFMRQTAEGAIRVAPMVDEMFRKATALIENVHPVQLRTLDALHLAAAATLGADVLATADAVMRQAGERLGLEVAFFGTAG
jgi:uncharacterized protein